MHSYLIAASTTVISLCVSIAIMIGLKLAGDNADSSKWFYNTVRANMVGSIFAVIFNYSVYLLGDSSVLDAGVLKLLLIIGSLCLMDVFIVQVTHCLMMYIATLSGKTRENDRFTNILSKAVLVSVGIILVSSLLGSITAISTGSIMFSDLSRVVTGVVLVVVELILLTSVLYSIKHLSKMRLSLFLCFIITDIAVLTYYAFSRANFFFTMSAIYLLLLFVTIQMESINLSNINTVRAALTTTENLNNELKHNMETLEHERNRLNEIADIFGSAYDIDIVNNSYSMLGVSPERVSQVLNNNENKPDVQTLMWNVMRRVISTSSVDDAIAFTDFSTLNQRMKGKKNISFETVTVDDVWMRYTFLRPDNDLDSQITRVWYVTQSIDREMKEIEHLNRVTYNDDLTGVLNRNAYIKEIDKLDKGNLPSDFWFVVADVNGLKTTNDTKGHEAGDELIVGTALCLKSAVGNAGNVYRIGGDEFICMVNGDSSLVEYIVEAVRRNRINWKGKLNEKLSFSVGFAGSSELENCKSSDLYREADKRMYESKEEYYKSL